MPPFLASEVRPATHQTRGEMLQLSQFDLHFALVALGTLREDIEDQAGSIDDPCLQGSAPDCAAVQETTHG